MRPIVFAFLLTVALPSMPAEAAGLGGILYYPNESGVVSAVNVETGSELFTVASTAFTGGFVGAGREIAFDPVTRLMWYSATDGLVHSVHVDSLASGPSITSIPGANVGAARHVFIDYSRRKLMTPITDGSIQMYNLSDQSTAGTIPATFFTDGNVGEFRHLASDQRDGNVWYAATDGSFREIDPDSLTHTGRTIPFSVQTGANPGASRHMVVDLGRNLLLYAVTNGSLASINLTTLLADSFGLSSAVFDSPEPGAGRIITYDSPSAATPVPGLTVPGLALMFALLALFFIPRARRRARPGLS